MAPSAAPVQAAALPPPTAAAPHPPAAPRAAAPAPEIHPSWYVEDDPTAFDAAHPPVAAAPGTGKRMVVTTEVDVRSGPDASSPSMGVLQAGAVIAVGDCNRWCAVTIDGRTGWVFSAFLSEAGATALR
jgi:hypothetical protein